MSFYSISPLLLIIFNFISKRKTQIWFNIITKHIWQSQAAPRGIFVTSPSLTFTSRSVIYAPVTHTISITYQTTWHSPYPLPIRPINLPWQVLSLSKAAWEATWPTETSLTKPENGSLSKCVQERPTNWFYWFEHYPFISLIGVPGLLVYVRQANVWTVVEDPIQLRNFNDLFHHLLDPALLPQIPRSCIVAVLRNGRACISFKV